MTISDFNVSFNEVENLLKLFGLFRQKGVKRINTNGVSDSFKKASNKNSYFAAYKTGIENLDYDFLLEDESFFQFEFKPNSKLGNFPDIRYAFFQNPQEYKTYKDFLQEFGMQEDAESMMFQEDYDQFLTEQQLNTNAMTIRFDADLVNHEPLVHSVAHVHIGFNNNIRVPLDKIISPLMFVLFVVKQIYTPKWENLIRQKNGKLLSYLEKTKKNSSSDLDPKKWTKEEQYELFFK